MDRILEGLLRSSQPNKVRHAVFQRVKMAGQTSPDPSTVIGVFRTCTETILSSTERFEQDACKDVYETWARYNRATLCRYFTDRHVVYLLQDVHENPLNVVWLVEHSINHIQFHYAADHPEYIRLCQVIQALTCGFLRRHEHYRCVAAYCRMLNHNRYCIPSEHSTLPFCICIITAVSKFTNPSMEKMKEMKEYVSAVSDSIGHLLQHIWQHSDDSCIRECLQSIFSIISYEDEERDVAPNMALAGIIHYIPLSFIDSSAKAVVNDTRIQNSRLQSAILRIIDWLSWPGVRNMHMWVIAFLKQLDETQRVTMLLEITDLSIESVFRNIRFPVIRTSCFLVVEHMLFSSHSPDPFHKIAPMVPWLVSQIQKEHPPENLKFLAQLSELIYCLMNQFPGYPDVYETLIECFKDQQQPSTQTITRRLKQSRRISYERADSVISSANYVRRSETAHTGLVNLGNTCYMNSVLQALYMCDRQAVLQKPPGHDQMGLMRLQEAFAFLTASQRPAYAPTNFLKECRPPWFATGAQQDCSEFLRYFLDTVHEQEKARLRKDREMYNTLKSSKEKLRDKKSGKVEKDPEHVSETLVEHFFGGKLRNIYRCLNCRQESSRAESFNDLSLSFGEGAASNKSRSSDRLVGGTNNGSDGNRSKSPSLAGEEATTLEDLLDYYLAPEVLEGENKYACQKCGSLQDAERTVQITQTPEYLVFTLLRFSYNAKLHARSKIFTDVQYPKTLNVPSCPEDTAEESPSVEKRGESGKRLPDLPRLSPPGAEKTPPVIVDKYSLLSVVVHSGLSSDGGHYYCYARHAIPVESPPKSPRSPTSPAPDYLEDIWYLFNDNRVTFSTHEAFSNVTRKFSKDTAYVLVYKKLHLSRPSERGLSPYPNIADLQKRSDLRQLIDSDNRNYHREYEQQERNRERQRKASLCNTSLNTSGWYGQDDPDDRGPPGSCGGGGGGGGGFGGGGFGGPRLVF